MPIVGPPVLIEGVWDGTARCIQLGLQCSPIAPDGIGRMPTHRIEGEDWNGYTTIMSPGDDGSDAVIKSVESVVVPVGGPGEDHGSVILMFVRAYQFDRATIQTIARDLDVQLLLQLDSLVDDIIAFVPAVASLWHHSSSYKSFVSGALSIFLSCSS